MGNWRSALVSLPLVLAAALSGCFSGEEDGPYLDMAGGGFVFNYRIAEATAGFVAVPRRTLPEGAVIEASFENPAGGDAIVLTQPVEPGETRYDFTTPPLSGVKADVPYKVTLRLVAADGSELEKLEKDFRSEIDQSVLPERPLTVGPGYHRNPEAGSGQDK